MSTDATKRPGAGRSLLQRAAARVRHLLREKLWGMDIHPSCWIERTAWIDRTWPRGVHIGRDAYIGEEAVILTHDFTRGVYLDTRIGARSIIGARAIIMPGCQVGDDSLVMPGAVVTRDVPPHSVASGNPAETSPRDPLGGA